MRMSRYRLKSQFSYPGPRIVSGLSLPTRRCPAGTIWKAEVLNHCFKVWGAAELGLLIKSGLPVAGPTSRPTPPGSTADVVAVRYCPDPNEMMPLATKPPRMRPAAPCWLAKKGSGYTKLVLKMWVRSRSVWLYSEAVSDEFWGVRALVIALENV